MNWDEYFVGIAEAVSKKSHCLSVKRGCILVNNKQHLSSGYNGPPRGYRNCDAYYDICPRRIQGLKSGEGLEICPASHAETNAIVQAAMNGVKIDGAVLYCNFNQVPCRECAKLIVNSGITEIVFNDAYVTYPQPGLTGTEILKECGITLRRMHA
jgi:dCMP deaminase